MKRPPLTARVVRGLGDIVSLASINLENGPEGSEWYGTLSEAEVNDADAARVYLQRLLQWHEERARAR